MLIFAMTIIFIDQMINSPLFIMNRLFVAITLFILAGVSASARNVVDNATNERVTISFPFNDNIEHRGLLGILDAYQKVANLHTTNDSYKFYKILMTVSRDGTNESLTLGYVPVSPDSTSICITVMAVDSTTCRVYLAPGAVSPVTVSLSTKMCLLIDYSHEDGYNVGDTVPMMAYSTGFHRRFKLDNGEMADGYDICGLRYSGVNPAYWHSKFDLKDYIYFEAVPIKEIHY